MSKQQFVTNLLTGTNCTVVSGVGILKLSGDRIARYSMYQGRCHGDYIGVLVEIINKDKGAIDRLVFKFDEQLASPKCDNNNPHFHVLENVRWDWYSYEPCRHNLNKMIDQINLYVGFYQ